MTVQLQIRFVGLFTFVQRDDVTYALAPITGGHGHPGAEEAEALPLHEARLFFGEVDLIDHRVPLPWSIPLAGQVLRIRDADRAPGTPRLPDLLDVSELGGGARVKRAALGAPPAPHAIIHSRVDLDLHGNVSPVAKARYRIPDANGQPTERAAATFVDWTESLDAKDLTLELAPLAGGPATVLHPPASNPDTPKTSGTIHLTVYHVIREEMPPAPPPPRPTQETPIHHFGAYYTAFDGVTEAPIPILLPQGPPGKGVENGSCPSTRGRS